MSWASLRQVTALCPSVHPSCSLSTVNEAAGETRGRPSTGAEVLPQGVCGLFGFFCDPFLRSFPRKAQTVSHKIPFPDSFGPESTSGRLATPRLCRRSCGSAAFGEVERRNSIAPYPTSSRKPIFIYFRSCPWVSGMDFLWSRLASEDDGEEPGRILGFFFPPFPCRDLLPPM